MCKIVPFPAGPVTGEDVRRAAQLSGATKIDNHTCSICGYMTRYLIVEGALYYDRGCHCVPNQPDSVSPRDWEEAAGWINQQTNEEFKRNIMARFGFGSPILPDAEANPSRRPDLDSPLFVNVDANTSINWKDSGFTANHWFSNDGNPAGGCTYGAGFVIFWQNGPLGRGDQRKEPNGAFVENIISAVINRLKFYQATKFECGYNEEAIECLQRALAALESRTADREGRGVEGTNLG